MKKEEVLLVNHNEFGIEQSQAKEILGNLPDLIEERNSFQEEFDQVMSMDEEDPYKTEKAREVRLKYKEHRTKGIMSWHKLKKDVFLRGGQFVDALKRDQVAINEDREAKLIEIEKRAEILEKKRLEDLQVKRVEILSKYVEDAEERDLSSMEEDVWEAYLSTKKKEYSDRIKAEEKAEKERIQQEKKVKLYNERKEELIPFWSFLKEDHKSADFGEIPKKQFDIMIKEAEESKNKYEKEQEKIRVENERLRKEQEAAEAKEQERIAAEKEKERIANEKAEAERKAYEEKIAKQEAEAARLRKEKLDREVAEEKAKAEALEAERKAKAAPDKEKLNKAVESLSLPTPGDLTRSIQTHETLKELQNKLEGYKKWAKDLIEKL